MRFAPGRQGPQAKDGEDRAGPVRMNQWEF